MLAALASAAAAGAQSVEATKLSRIVVDTNAPVFVRPDATTTPLRVAKQGSALNVIEIEGDWYRVEFQDPEFGRRVGYIEKRHVTAVPARPAALDLTVPEAPSDVRPGTSAANRLPVRAANGGVLDEIKLYVNQPPSTRVVIRRFSASDADLVKGNNKEETKTLQADGPRMLAERFATKLKEIGPFTQVTVLEPGEATPADALVVEGRFTELDPGSRAKRYWVGFGAGKSAVAVEGSVKSADGTLLATFQQRRIGVMGVYGGDSLGKLSSDSKSIGEDIAKFMSAWATGKNLN
jgi:hypothetical protein